ncbi:hypothetical protein [Devosia lacusdianchii]|jgi:hypothetical protein|uniref:hypothetical protein n=1 Tax=Devosia lacusdianchii TaxID=2917991 RepID=UPI001F06A7D1|nr:hypothetical protein [Devosia sp. JXJ CY 41]
MRTLVFYLLLTLFVVPLAHAEQLGGYTNMTWDAGHGTQVEYLSTRGKAYLWYPGNAVILEGRWKREGTNICFAYGENTYNPVTGNQGGDWECMPSDLYQAASTERMQGDVLALADRATPPFRLDRARTTLNKLIARASR